MGLGQSSKTPVTDDTDEGESGSIHKFSSDFPALCVSSFVAQKISREGGQDLPPSIALSVA